MFVCVVLLFFRISLYFALCHLHYIGVEAEISTPGLIELNYLYGDILREAEKKICFHVVYYVGAFM